MVEKSAKELPQELLQVLLGLAQWVVTNFNLPPMDESGHRGLLRIELPPLDNVMITLVERTDGTFLIETYWDDTGEQDVFVQPVLQSETQQLTEEELENMMGGIDE